MRVVAVIPARLGSTRLSRKVLRDIAGRPMLWHVFQSVRRATMIDELLVATDSHEVVAAVEQWGGRVVMTSPRCRCGTDRIASILDRLEGDFVINIQADEPLMHPDLVDSLVRRWVERQSRIITPVYRITSLDELENPSVVKVVRSASGRAIYFSRAPVPFLRDVPRTLWLSSAVYWGHVGAYGFAPSVLSVYGSMPPSPLEELERLEQLRLVEAGYEIDTIETTYRPIGVDTLEDLLEVRRRFLRPGDEIGDPESPKLRVL
jgi:3-deoxy-manno-octulosonate cytidylyltransferase (CMP-KDO synthetase)